MPKYDKQALIKELSPPLEKQLVQQLLDEFVSLEKRFVLRDWEPATLDGGQFSEAASRIIYHRDSGNLNLRKAVDDCLKYVEDPKNQNSHSFPDRKSSLHLCKIIRGVYKLRSDRGAVHIDPTYTANHLDSRLIIENARWILAEIIRIFWRGSRDQVATAIRQIVEYDIPAIGDFEGRFLVQRVDCTVEEEILILLHYAGELGYSRYDLGRFVKGSSSSVTRAIRKLSSSRVRQVVPLGNGNYRLTDIGIRYVLTTLSDKLTL